MSQTAQLDSSMTQDLVNQVYERLFGESGQFYDLYEGTISSAANVRIIYLSTDIIRGIYDALSYEAGEAWSLILHNCGVRWGKRTAASLERELRALANRRMDGLIVREYCDLLESYFAFHGWGKLKIHLELAQSDGVVYFSLTNGIFSSVLTNVAGPVDHMIEGMLCGMFGVVSGGHALGCAQVIPDSPKPYETVYFLLSGADRIESVASSIVPGMALEDALRVLRAA
jgi:uncharacterized protein